MVDGKEIIREFNNSKPVVEENEVSRALTAMAAVKGDPVISRSLKKRGRRTTYGNGRNGAV